MKTYFLLLVQDDVIQARVRIVLGEGNVVVFLLRDHRLRRSWESREPDHRERDEGVLAPSLRIHAEVMHVNGRVGVIEAHVSVVVVGWNSVAERVTPPDDGKEVRVHEAEVAVDGLDLLEDGAHCHHVESLVVAVVLEVG